MGSSSAERRSAILSAAGRLFEHYGHGKTTIADVAREAQVGVGTVYLEFASKEALIQELSASAHVGVLEAMRRASAHHEDHAARLAAALRARTRSFLELRRRGQHACELVHCTTDGVRAAHARFREQEKVLFAAIVREGQRVGTFARREPTSIAALIQRAFASLAPPAIDGSDDEALRASSALSDLLIHGLVTDARAASRRARRTR